MPGPKIRASVNLHVRRIKPLGRGLSEKKLWQWQVDNPLSRMCATRGGRRGYTGGKTEITKKNERGVAACSHGGPGKEQTARCMFPCGSNSRCSIFKKNKRLKRFYRETCTLQWVASSAARVEARAIRQIQQQCLNSCRKPRAHPQTEWG